jgi:hypothetical protein
MVQSSNSDIQYAQIFRASAFLPQTGVRMMKPRMDMLTNVLLIAGCIGCKVFVRPANLSQTNTNNTTTNTAVEFAVNENSFFIVSQNKEVIQQECEHLKKYGAFIASRNGLPQAAECLATATSSELKSTLAYPAYSYSKETFWNSYRESVFWHADISEIIPREMWARFREHKVYNSVCYNSAMVGSGIFPISGYSLFEPPVDTLLGFLQPSVEKSADGTYKTSMVRNPETNAMVVKRKSWEVNANGNADEIAKSFDLISKEIADGFTPANVMCIAIGKYKKSGEVIREIQKAVGGLAVGADSQEPVEQAGGHCLNLVTPSLVMEANRELAINFTHWRRAFESYASMGKDEPITFHYISLNPNAVLSWSQAPNILTQPQFAKLMSIAREFRSFHESIPLSPDVLKNSQIRLSDLLRTGDSHPETLAFKSYVANKLIPALEAPEFKDFKKALEGGGVSLSISQSAAAAYWGSMLGAKEWK